MTAADEQQVEVDSMLDVANMLIHIGRRNPSEISNYIQLLSLISCSNVKAVCRIQRTTRNWIRRRRERSRKDFACLRIQRAARKWLLLLPAVRYRSAEIDAAVKIRCLYRRICFRRCVEYRFVVNYLGGGPSFLEGTRGPEEQQEYPDTLRSVVDFIWETAKDWNLLCTNDDEAKRLDNRKTMMLNQHYIDVMLAVIADNSFDNDTKILCHMLCHQTSWCIVDSSHGTPIKKFISTSQIEQIRDMCVANLSSMNFVFFRAAVKLLVELQYLCPMSIPNDIVKRLQTRLKDINYRPGNLTLKILSSVPLSGKDFVLKMESEVSSDIVRLLHSSLLFRNG